MQCGSELLFGKYTEEELRQASESENENEMESETVASNRSLGHSV